jgi:cytochrome c556
MRRRCALVAAGLVMSAACDRPAEHADTGRGDSPVATSGIDAHATAGDRPQEGLALRPIMQELGGEMAKLTTALWIEDFAGITASASAIADHAHISEPELSRIQRVLGEEMRAFETLDREVHEASVRLHEAAQARALDTIVDALGEVQRGCVACHSRFRERLRTTPQ